MKIAGRTIGQGHPPYIVAEIGASHNGQLANALDLIKAAQECGADAVKTQVYSPHDLAEQRGGLDHVIEWRGEQVSLYDLYAAAYTPRSWFPAMFDYAEKIGITLFSSVFDTFGVEFLEGLGRCPAYKISAYELTDLPLVRKAASTAMPIIISTASRNVITIGDAYVAAQEGGARDIAILHCVSKYPCPTEGSEVDLISGLQKQFPIVGFSDHTMGSEAAIAALKQGAVIFEKHIKLWGDTTSPDSGFASTPGEFADYVMAIRKAAKGKAAA